VSFAAITLCVVSKRVLIFVIIWLDSVRKLLDIYSYLCLSTPFQVTSQIVYSSIIFIVIVRLACMGRKI
jgi:hypothetical protein